MDVFKSWLIANLEIVLYIIMPLIIVINFFFIGAEHWMLLSALTIGIMVLSSAFIKSGLGVFLFMAFFAVLGLVNTEGALDSLSSFYGNLWKWLIIMAVVAVIFGIFIAIYAYANFDEVVSRRFLYRNSAASVFEQAWKYAFNRQFAGFMLIMGISLEIITMIALSRHIDTDDETFFALLKEDIKHRRDSVEAAKQVKTIAFDDVLVDDSHSSQSFETKEEPTIAEELSVAEEVIEQKIVEPKPKERDNNKVKLTTATILNGSIKSGVNKQPLMMSISIQDNVPNHMGSVTGNYQYKNNDERVQSDYVGLFYYDTNDEIRLNLISESELAWFDLVWNADRSAYGFFYTYKEQTEFEKRSDRYKKKYTVELSGMNK